MFRALGKVVFIAVLVAAGSAGIFLYYGQFSTDRKLAQLADENRQLHDIVVRLTSERRVAQMLGAPMTTVSSALDRLEQRKLLARRRRPGDRRVVYVELTARGRQLAGKIHASQVAMCAEMLAELKVRERKEMVRLVLRLAKAS